MASQLIDMCNAALVKLGAKTITSLTDGSANATACNNSYTRILRAELRDHPWGFAKALALIDKDAIDPAFGRAYQYTLPSDFLRLLDPLVEDDTLDRDWEIHGQKIHTDDASPFELRYIKKLEQVTITGVSAADPGVVTAAGHGFKHGDRVRITSVAGMTEVNDLDFMAVVPTVAITAITKADPAVVTAASHGYLDGEHVLLAGILGMTELNNRKFVVANKTVGTFELQSFGEENIDSTDYGEYSSAGTAQRTDKFSLYTVDGVKVDTSGYSAYSSGGVAELLIIDELFKEAFTTRLAAELSEVITQSNSKRRELWEEYAQIFPRAKKQNAGEKAPQEPMEDYWISVRR